MITFLRTTLPRFLFLVPLHALEFVTGGFITAMGLWMTFTGHPLVCPPIEELYQVLGTGHFSMGVVLISLGILKSGLAVLDFQAVTKVTRFSRVVIAVFSLALWISVIANGLVLGLGIMMLRFFVLTTAELWTIITAGKSRAGGWD